MSSEALAKEDWSFGGLRRTAGATGSCPWGSTNVNNERRRAQDSRRKGMGLKCKAGYAEPRSLSVHGLLSSGTPLMRSRGHP